MRHRVWSSRSEHSIALDQFVKTDLHRMGFVATREAAISELAMVFVPGRDFVRPSSAVVSQPLVQPERKGSIGAAPHDTDGAVQSCATMPGLKSPDRRGVAYRRLAGRHAA